MYQLKIGSIDLPKLYVCDSRTEAYKARELGVPYIIKPSSWDDDKLIVAVLWNTLNKMFPYIDWKKKFNLSRKPQLVVHDPKQVEVAAEYRCTDGCLGGFSDDMQVTDGGEYRPSDGGSELDAPFTVEEWIDHDIDDYIGDIGYSVNVEELQALRILPVFMDDIATAIKTNLYNTSWIDGWNKKLGAPLGYYQGGDQAPNLIILDTSGSIPSGVAYTMCSLIDTLRHQANADLIITSHRSGFYPANEELPSPDKLANYIGGANECRQFYEIMRKHILGKHWGNVIVFGDQDAPNDDRFRKHSSCFLKDSEVANTRIDNLMCFHTYRSDRIPGYGLWAIDITPKGCVSINNNWVEYMKDRRRW